MRNNASSLWQGCLGTSGRTVAGWRGKISRASGEHENWKGIRVGPADDSGMSVRRQACSADQKRRSYPPWPAARGHPSQGNCALQGGSGMIVNHNLTAINSQRHLFGLNRELDRSLERLSSGMKINHGADDAYGLAIAEKMNTQNAGLTVPSRSSRKRWRMWRGSGRIGIQGPDPGRPTGEPDRGPGEDSGCGYCPENDGVQSSADSDTDGDGHVVPGEYPGITGIAVASMTEITD